MRLGTVSSGNQLLSCTPPSGFALSESHSILPGDFSKSHQPFNITLHGEPSTGMTQTLWVPAMQVIVDVRNLAGMVCDGRISSTL